MLQYYCTIVVLASQAQVAGQKRKRVSRFDTPPGSGTGSSSGPKSGSGSSSGPKFVHSSDELAIAEAMASFGDSSAEGLSASQERQLQEQIAVC